MAWVNCVVNEVGPASDATDTTAPVIYINLTDSEGSFANTWFYAAAGVQKEMLAVAIAAINQDRRVEAGLVPPNANNTPYTPVTRMYLLAKA